jgi:hypothetical protein
VLPLRRNSVTSAMTSGQSVRCEARASAGFVAGVAAAAAAGAAGAVAACGADDGAAAGCGLCRQAAIETQAATSSMPASRNRDERMGIPCLRQRRLCVGCERRHVSRSRRTLGSTSWCSSAAGMSADCRVTELPRCDPHARSFNRKTREKQRTSAGTPDAVRPVARRSFASESCGAYRCFSATTRCNGSNRPRWRESSPIGSGSG